MQENTFNKIDKLLERYRQKNFFSVHGFIFRTIFSFSSTSTLAGERLNKDYYFFFQNI